MNAEANTEGVPSRPRRLDTELVARGLARSREHAVERIRAGEVDVDGRTTRKAATRVGPDARLAVRGEASPWVGRAAYKLLGALERWSAHGLSANGRRCLDIGASTGGFTQVLLEHGATHVTALDVGHGQLVARLGQDERVRDLPGTNIRDVGAGDLGDAFDLVVADLSFISLRLVLPVVRQQLADQGDAVLLVKPQFEVGRERLARTGIVTSPGEHGRVLAEVIEAADAAGLRLRDLARSPLPGGDGNVEFLAWFTPGPTQVGDRADVTIASAASERRSRWQGMIDAALDPSQE